MGTITPKIEKDYNFYEASEFAALAHHSSMTTSLPSSDHDFPIYTDHLAVKPPIPTVLTARAAAHARCRRTMAHAFSTTALKGQEPIMQRHVDEFISGLRTASARGTESSDDVDTSRTSSAKVDVNEWVQKAVFDMIGDLALGNDFGLLKGAVAKLSSAETTSIAAKPDTSSPTITTEPADPATKTKKPARPIDETMAALRPASAIVGLASHAGFRFLLRTVSALTLKLVRDELSSTLLTKLKARLKVVKEDSDGASYTEEKRKSSDVRKDLAYYLIEKSRSEGAGPKMTEDEMEVNLLILLVAGAETTAVLVTVAIW